MSGYDNRDINPVKIYQASGGNGPAIAVQPFKSGPGDYAAAVCNGNESAIWLSNQVAPILLNCLKAHELTHLGQYDQIALQMGFPLREGKPGSTACAAFGVPGLVVDMAAHKSMVNQMEFEAHQVHFQCLMKQYAGGLAPSDVEIVSKEVAAVLRNLNMFKGRVEADNGVGPTQ